VYLSTHIIALGHGDVDVIPLLLVCPEKAASTGELKEEEKGGRVIYGKDIDKESDDIKYKWNAIFHK
jgi:hypothetical protein